MNEILVNPVKGIINDIVDSTDPVFSDKLVGDGIFVIPNDTIVVAPCDGTIQSIMETKHALTLYSSENTPVMIHIGVDTVELKGEGFEVYVKQDQKVKQGDPLVKVDFDFIKNKGYEIETLMMIPDENKKVFKKNIGNSLENYEAVLTIGA
ncbi:TPA: PTS glucose transporter subunit IIA [Enterococcus faecium]|nr:PTS glucose transporter subunit IIA [Enterococcus faecium]